MDSFKKKIYIYALVGLLRPQYSEDYLPAQIVSRRIGFE